MLNSEELERYKRQIAIPGLGEAGQAKIKKASILIVGAGGLGSAASLYLAAAGIGFLRIIDSDKVELSNLNRQLLHTTPDIGREKTESAGEKLRALNSNVNFELIQDRVDRDNVGKLLKSCDAILDATDNLETRYILNAAALKAGLPFFHGAVAGFEGRALTVLPRQSACLMCLYRGVTLNVKPAVIGFTAGVIGCIQAAEAIKYITGLGQLLAGRLLIYDGLNMRFNEVQVSRDPHCPQCGG